MAPKKVTFENSSGHKLAALLDQPKGGQPVAYALFAHCFTCNKDFKAPVNISRSLVNEGIGVLRFDFTGLGDSEGDFSDTNFTSNVDDLIAAARFVEDNYGPVRILVGHSLGGTAALWAAPAIANSVAVATINSPYEPAHLTHVLAPHREKIESEGSAEVEVGGISYTINKQFLDDVEAADARTAIAALDRALLVFHAPDDDTVSIDNASRIFLAAKHPKSFVSLDTANHLLSDRADSQYIGSVIAAWAHMYLAAGDGTESTREVSVDGNPATTEPDTGSKLVTARTGPSGYATDIEVRSHQLVADEPLDAGGTDQGPTPYDLLLAALNACTSMTLRMYADRKEWTLESVIVRSNHRKVHAKDCAECESEHGWVDRIERSIELHGELDGEQRQRLLEIAERCPVHRTLHSEVIVKTSLHQPAAWAR